VFVEADSQRELLALLAIVNSRPFRELVAMQMAFGSYEVGVIQRTPVPALNEEASSALAHCGASRMVTKAVACCNP
jgi:hypothetical protein